VTHAFLGLVALHWLRLFLRWFFANPFKRSCLPDGPKVGSISLSPRGNGCRPSDARAALWLAGGWKISARPAIDLGVCRVGFVVARGSVLWYQGGIVSLFVCNRRGEPCPSRRLVTVP
jgi:hypothetical protein